MLLRAEGGGVSEPSAGAVPLSSSERWAACGGKLWKTCFQRNRCAL